MTVPAADCRMEWRGAFGNDELERLHAGCFPGFDQSNDWWGQVSRHSLGWICLRDDAALAGFLNLAWDGGAHGFVLDVMVHEDYRRCGLATRMIGEAADRAREQGCTWLHVDFEPGLLPLYRSAGFLATDAGLIRLRQA